MEDMTTMIAMKVAAGPGPGGGGGGVHFCGVYDGHGGDIVSIELKKRLHLSIACQRSFKRGDVETAIKRGCHALDRMPVDSQIDAPALIKSCESVFFRKKMRRIKYHKSFQK